MIAVWFSHGAPSACALKLTIDRYGVENVRAVNNPIVEEDEDNRRFGREIAEWCGIEIEEFKAPKYPSASAVDVWTARKAMSFPNGAPCTRHLKIEARQAWEAINKPEWHVLGFTAEEAARHQRFILTERENVLPILIDAGMTRGMCADMIRGAGIPLPRVYDWGLPNANCLGCVKATSPTYWNTIRRVAPEVFRQRAEQSREIGAKLVRVGNQRIYLDELHPLSRGRPLNSMPDCGLFCEEPRP